MSVENKEAISKAPSGRVTRTPVGQRNRLTVKGKDPNYHYRIVNEIDDNVERMKELGYELVPADSVQVGDKRVNAPATMGSYKQLSVGQGTKAAVMRIKKDWFEEDQAAKQTHIAELERSTKEKALSNATYGELNLSRD